MRAAETGTDLAFGELLRRHRAAAGVTQEDLANRTGITPQAVGLLERGKRRHPHAYTVEKLAEALGLGDRDLAEFEAAARRPPTRHTAEEPSRGSLPTPPTPLVGREEALEAVANLVRAADVRLLTLVGPGGVGKTRLALEVARLSREAFADGVVFVSLVPVRDPDLVPSVLAEALGVKDVANRSLEDAVKGHLEGKQLLLLMDNAEHLLSSAGRVLANLIESCPGLTVFVTSRAPLRLRGERQYPVPPLSVAESSSSASSPAMWLFRERAVAVAPDFELDAANVATVAEICRRLDGLPLAIELAAARIKVFPPKALLARLDRRLQLLSGGARDLPERQQTLRDTVGWSYDLLDADERQLFRRLAVFAGGFSLEAAEAVCGPGMPGGRDIPEILVALVDNSLLVSQPDTPDGDEVRMTMLETIREYAAGCLDSSDEADEVHRAHVLHYLELAEAAQPEASEQMLKAWIAVLERDHDNFRAALRWTIEHREVELGTHLALLMWRFWSERYYVSEGRRWLEAVLALGEPGGGVAEPTLPARRWAFLHLVTGLLASSQGDHDRAIHLYEKSLALYRKMGHRKAASGPLRELATVAYLRGDYDRAVSLGEQSLDITREFESTFGYGLTICTLADALHAQGDVERARTLLEESLPVLRRKAYPQRVANALANVLARLGNIECESGNFKRASELYEESLSLAQRYGFTFHAVFFLGGFARLEAARGRPERAARLLGTSAAVREEMGRPLMAKARTDHDLASRAARSQLGEEAFASAWEQGRATTLKEAIAEIVGDER